MSFKVGDRVLIIAAPNFPKIVGMDCVIWGPLRYFDPPADMDLVHEISVQPNGKPTFSPPEYLMKIDPSDEIMNEECEELEA